MSSPTGRPVPVYQSSVNMTAPAAKRPRPSTSPALAWFDEKALPNGKLHWVCRVINCRQAPFTNKSTTNFARHLASHQINCKTMTPFTDPLLLKESLRSTVIAMAVPAPASASSSSSPTSASAIAAALRLPPPSPLLSFTSSQVSVSSQASTSSLSSQSSISISSSSSSLPPLRSTVQPTLYSALSNANNPLVARAAAKLFARHALSHRLADSMEWTEFLECVRRSTCKVPNRATVKQAQSELAAQLRFEVIAKLRAHSVTSPISIAIDGWTNTRHHKVTNLLCLCGGQAYYWKSIVNRYDKNTAAWLLKPIAAAIAELLEYDIRIIALVADNEAVNGKLYKLLTPQFPFLLLSPCAAHTVQLCVNKALAVTGIKEVMKTMEGIVRQFRKGMQSKQLRLQLCNLQLRGGAENSIKQLVIPCDTRWSSHRAAGLRLLELQKYIDICDLPNPPADTFWPKLRELMNFLAPFQTTTDILQADNSTLYSVYDQFIKLQLAMDAIPTTSTFSSAKDAVHNIISENWEAHVNTSAALSCAWLSFNDRVRDYDADTQTATRKWFVQYALKYVQQYRVRTDVLEALWQGEIEVLWGQFTGRTAGSAFDDLNGTVERMKSAELARTARLGEDGQWRGVWYPANVWRFLEASAPLIAHPAIALLCVAGSEAAVERSFSAQDTVHTKKRNRLSDKSVQNEMFIRFNTDAVMPVEERLKRDRLRVLGGSCVELTVDFEEQPRAHGSVDALFKTIAIAVPEPEPAVAPGPVVAVAAVAEEKVEDGGSDGKEEVQTDSSDDEYVESVGQSESDSGSDSSVQPTQPIEIDEEQQQPVSRSATIARQVRVDEFIKQLVIDAGYTKSTKWNSSDTYNTIENASMKEDIKMQTSQLRKLIKAYVMSAE